MTDSSKNPETIAATCRICGTRVTPDIQFAGQKVKCPDCFTPIQIPTLEQHEQNKAARARQDVVSRGEIGTYSIAGSGNASGDVSKPEQDSDAASCSEPLVETDANTPHVPASKPVSMDDDDFLNSPTTRAMVSDSISIPTVGPDQSASTDDDDYFGDDIFDDRATTDVTQPSRSPSSAAHHGAPHSNAENTANDKSPGFQTGSTGPIEEASETFKLSMPVPVSASRDSSNSGVGTDSERPRRRKRRKRKPTTDRDPVSGGAKTGSGGTDRRVADEIEARLRRQEVPDPPKHLFFSNVFEFPWSSSSALKRWGMLSFAMLLMMLLGAFLLYLRETEGRAALIPIGFMALGQLALFGWASSYAAACSIAIIHDTSVGNDEVHGWPEGGMAEKFGDLFSLFVLFDFAGFFAYMTMLPIILTTGHTIPTIFIIHALFIPVTVLGGLDESVWYPISSMVIGSFRTVPKAWLGFMMLANGLVGLYFAVMIPLAIHFPFVGAMIGGPLTASVIFIYSRLLGRLAYTIGVHAPEEAVPEEDQ